MLLSSLPAGEPRSAPPPSPCPLGLRPPHPPHRPSSPAFGSSTPSHETLESNQGNGDSEQSSGKHRWRRPARGTWGSEVRMTRRGGYAGLALAHPQKRVLGATAHSRLLRMRGSSGSARPSEEDMGPHHAYVLLRSDPGAGLSANVCHMSSVPIYSSEEAMYTLWCLSLNQKKIEENCMKDIAFLAHEPLI